MEKVFSVTRQPVVDAAFRTRLNSAEATALAMESGLIDGNRYDHPQILFVLQKEDSSLELPDVFSLLVAARSKIGTTMLQYIESR